MRCTDCPNNAETGDIYNHSAFGKLTYGKQGWADTDGIIIMNDVVITNTFLNMSTGKISIVGLTVVNIYEKTIPRIDKMDFLIKRIDPKYATEFLNTTPSLTMGNVYEKGYKESLKSLKNLKKGLKFGGYVFTALDFYGAIENVQKGNYNGAVADGIKSTGSVLSNALPIAGPLVYEGIWAFGDNYLIKQEWYNRAFFGVHSRVYKERGYQYGYIGNRFFR